MSCALTSLVARSLFCVGLEPQEPEAEEPRNAGRFVESACTANEKRFLLSPGHTFSEASTIKDAWDPPGISMEISLRELSLRTHRNRRLNLVAVASPEDLRAWQRGLGSEKMLQSPGRALSEASTSAESEPPTMEIAEIEDSWDPPGISMEVLSEICRQSPRRSPRLRARRVLERSPCRSPCVSSASERSAVAA
jgi:hypothetical protein